MSGIISQMWLKIRKLRNNLLIMCLKLKTDMLPILAFLILVTACNKQKTVTPTPNPPVPTVDLTPLKLPKGVKPDQVTWQNTEGVLTFTKSTNFSDLTNADEDKEGFYWTVPTVVKKVIINQNVKITGGFRAIDVLTIEGKDRATSEIFGTNTKAWSLGADAQDDPNTSCQNGAKGDDRVHDCEKWKYGAISSTTATSVTIMVKNLTITNARSYAITSFSSKFIVDNVHIRNTRTLPDYHSNSDGISAGAGSIVRNSKIDTWDDEIKLYRDITVENVTLIHNSNGAPFQLGWGNDNNITNHSIKNVLVVVNNKNYSNLALFSASLTTGKVNRNVTIDGLKVQYDATQKVRNTDPMPLFLMKSPDAVLNITVPTNGILAISAPIAVGGTGKVNINACGTTAVNNAYSCGDAAKVTGCGW
jgi:hypothetical protein